MLYGRPFLSDNLVTNPEMDSFLMYVMDLGTFQQEHQRVGNKILPAPMKGGNLQIAQVLIKS
jgi:hypothetical protein